MPEMGPPETVIYFERTVSVAEGEGQCFLVKFLLHHG
jgi:hypothetical protein